jgi:hypothetical protein
MQTVIMYLAWRALLVLFREVTMSSAASTASAVQSVSWLWTSADIGALGAQSVFSSIDHIGHDDVGGFLFFQRLRFCFLSITQVVVQAVLSVITYTIIIHSRNDFRRLGYNFILFVVTCNLLISFLLFLLFFFFLLCFFLFLCSPFNGSECVVILFHTCHDRYVFDVGVAGFLCLNQSSKTWIVTNIVYVRI